MDNISYKDKYLKYKKKYLEIKSKANIKGGTTYITSLDENLQLEQLLRSDSNQLNLDELLNPDILKDLIKSLYKKFFKHLMEKLDNSIFEEDLQMIFYIYNNIENLDINNLIENANGLNNDFSNLFLILESVGIEFNEEAKNVQEENDKKESNQNGGSNRINRSRINRTRINRPRIIDLPKYTFWELNKMLSNFIADRIDYGESD